MSGTTADRIKQIRKELGLTLQGFGELAGISKSAVQQWESGETKNIRNENLFLLQRKTGYSAEWIVTGFGEKKLWKGSSEKYDFDYVRESEATYSVEEQQLVNKYRHLTGHDQTRIQYLIDALVSAKQELDEEKRSKK